MSRLSFIIVFQQVAFDTLWTWGIEGVAYFPLFHILPDASAIGFV